MSQKQITIFDDLADKVEVEAKSRGISETMLVTDILTLFFEHTGTAFSYQTLMTAIENDLINLIEKYDVREFTLGDLNSFKKIERVSSNFKPSAIKATLGKNFLKKVNDSQKNYPYNHIIRSTNEDGSLRFRNRAALYYVIRKTVS